MLYFILMPLLALVKIQTQGRLSKKNASSVSDALMLNGLIFSAVVIVMIPLFYRGLPSKSIILPAIAYGIFNALFQFFYILAFKAGSVGLATVINNFSIVVPMIFGTVVYGEKLSIPKGIGLMLLAIPLILIPKRDGKKSNKKWLIFTLLAFLSSGISGIVSMVCSHGSMSEYDSRMVIMFGYAVALVLSFALFAVTKRQKSKIQYCPTFFAGVILIGLVLGLYNILLITGLRHIPSILLYPVTSVLTILLIVGFDIFVNKEKLDKKQIIGITVGIVCVVLLNI